MERIETDNWGCIEITTTDFITGEGTGDLRLDINSEYCSAWINLEPEEVKKLRDKLNKFLDDFE